MTADGRTGIVDDPNVRLVVSAAFITLVYFDYLVLPTLSLATPCPLSCWFAFTPKFAREGSTLAFHLTSVRGIYGLFGGWSFLAQLFTDKEVPLSD